MASTPAMKPRARFATWGIQRHRLNLSVKRHAWQATVFVTNLLNKRSEVDLNNGTA
jgi:hypothetical protein